MAVSNVYSIFDVVAGVYSAPFFCVSDVVAVRVFRSAMHPESMIVQFPNDYQLHYIGTFDDSTGLITSDLVNSFVCSAVDYVSDSSELSNHEV